jgi:glutamyl-tRNA reductase
MVVEQEQTPRVGESSGAKLRQARGTPIWCASTERVRARETERVLRKLDLSREQAEAVERVSRSLVEKLVHGPIAKVTAIIERTGESAAGREA